MKVPEALVRQRLECFVSFVAVEPWHAKQNFRCDTSLLLRVKSREVAPPNLCSKC